MKLNVNDTDANKEFIKQYRLLDRAGAISEEDEQTLKTIMKEKRNVAEGREAAKETVRKYYSLQDRQ